MSSTKALENPQAVNEVASLLIPVAGRQLLVPTVTVAEMIPYRNPEPVDGAPSWYLGNIVWREQPVPLLCYEVLNGDPKPGYNSGCRIAVLNNTGVDESLPFMAIPTQGIPRLSRVKPEEISQREDLETKEFDLMAVFHAGESVIIPNVEALERAYLNYRNR